jgi:predicted enzyme related to lactoylglutathione lyase
VSQIIEPTALPSARSGAPSIAAKTENGVCCVQEPTEIFGARVAQYVDPDGMTFGVGEERRGG